MKIAFNILLIMTLAYFAHIYLPFWWLFALIAFLISFAFGENTWKSFLVGFSAIFILWIILTSINSISNDFILVERMANVLPFKNSILLIIVSSFIGGLIGGFSSLTGYYLKTFND